MDAAAQPSARLDAHALERWGRNLSFFSGCERDGRTRFDYQLALRESTATLIGLGGTGSWAALTLAMAGVGRIIGVDHDRVTMHNLNRQVLYRPADVGRLKAEAAAESLAALAPEMEFRALARKVQSEADAAEVIAGSDIVLLAADQPMGLITRWLNAACFARRIPLLELGIAAHWAYIGPLYVPGLTGCWECEAARQHARSKYHDEWFQAMRERPVEAPPSLASMCGIDGTHAAHEALAYLSGVARPATLGRELVMDTRNMKVESREVKQQPGCPVCHVSAAEMPRRAAWLAPAQLAGNLGFWKGAGEGCSG
jgi:bacteriocin biosynthesis cyclodehydratase domain-containing protein